MAVDTQRGGTTGGADDAPARASLFYDPKVRSLVAQVVLIVLVAWAFYAIWANTVENLERQNIASGFDFLDRTAGFGIIQSLVDYTEESSYGRTFIVGLLNTILVSAIGIVLATVLGFIVGVARLSSNWVISRMALGYVEVMRNIPLLLHIFIWYFAVLRALPQSRDEPTTLIPGVAWINVKGIYAPHLVTEPGFWMTGVALVVAFAMAFLVSKWANWRQAQTGQQFPVFWTGLGLIIALPLLVFIATGMPGTLEHPNFVSEGPILRRGFQQDVGLNIIPEFISLLLALSTYTAAYIAEIVRGGIQAVSHGQTEAAGALGLRRTPTLNLVVIPQAMRIIIPPMTNQYLNLTKNSSLATAIAYPDLVSVFAGTTLNQTGQAVEIILMTMAVYLTLSITISIDHELVQRAHRAGRAVGGGSR